MKLKIITQEEFEGFEVIGGIKICPTGDYSLIKKINEQCSFAEYCSFPKYCSFAEHCSFAKLCSFAEQCSFAEYCSLLYFLITDFVNSSSEPKKQPA